MEAGIAYWHTLKKDTLEKWSNIFDLYNHLLILEYSPVAALNRTYALSKTNGKQAALVEAEKRKLTGNLYYYSLLGNLYTNIDNAKAIELYETALTLSNSSANSTIIKRKIALLR